MSKYSSDFKRVKNDFYETPGKAVLPLTRHLDRASFTEPCAGGGKLVQHLEKYGNFCVKAFDIEPQAERVGKADALNEPFESFPGDYIITNPPWARPVLHRMIEKFSDIKPTWLLFDADWVHTNQVVMAKKHKVKDAVELRQRLCKYVSVGRVKWIEGSSNTGKENCAWYLFDRPHNKGVKLYGKAY